MRKAEPNPIDLNPDLLRAMGYEQRDIALKTLVQWGLGLLAFVAVSLVIAAGTYLFFIPKENMTSRFGVALTNQKVPEGAPVLQARPRRDMIMFRQAEMAQIERYNVTRKNGANVTTIPIERAMDMMAEKGEATAPNSTPGDTISTEATRAALHPSAAITPDTGNPDTGKSAERAIPLAETGATQLRAEMPANRGKVPAGP